jgi:2-(1,2-epoxy-1,2-dihydrophenyl)acetyl-CoA isomerase
MPLILNETHDSITTVTLNRPEKLNAFSGTMREELLDALRAAAENSDCRVVILTGAGRAFCAGGDIESMRGLQRERNTDAMRKLLDAGRDVVLQIAGMEKPVIASVNGVAAGAGCNLALACDYRIASDQAKFAESFVKIGLHPDWGGTFLLPRIVGRSRALEMMTTGRLVEAAEALRMGLVDRVVAAGELAKETNVLAQTIAAAPPIAVAGIKHALRESDRNDLRGQLEIETENQLRAFLSADATEGMAAFFEKRAPKFSGS